jgi:hypothetical protein
MKRIWLTMAIVLAAPIMADDIIPSLAKEEMSAYQSSFGRAIADSKRAEAKDKEKKAKENFGRVVSDAAKNMKSEILKDNKNFGSWVSKQKNHRREEAGKSSSAPAKSNSDHGRPHDKHGHGKKPR